MRLWLLTISFARSTTKVMYNAKRGKNILVYMYVYVYAITAGTSSRQAAHLVQYTTSLLI